MKIDLHFAGIFSRYPAIYCSDGAEQMFDDVDFAGMDKNEFVGFIQIFANEVCINVYFCMPDVVFPDGLRLIATDIDYMDFIEVGYASGSVINVCMDHLGVNVHKWILEEQGEICSSLDELSDRIEVGEEVQGGIDMDDGIEIEDLLGHRQGVTEDLQGTREELQDGERDDINIEVENDQGDMEDLQGSTEDWQGKEDDGIDLEVDNEPDECIPMNRTKDDKFLSKLCPNDQVTPNSPPHEELYEHAVDDEKLVLSMRFVNPKQLKHMLCDYAVANGYQLCYKKNDSRRLLVKCCSGACKFRLWASWMIEEKYFQIKSLINEHNCARNFKLGSIVNYALIGTHYTTQFLQKQKVSVRLLRDEVKENFGIDEIRRSNPRSTVKIDVNAMPDGELIVAVGRDANNHIFPIAWAVVCVENKANWKRFLENLKDDLHLEDGFGLSLMSDQHKGLLEDVKEVLPIAEHRQCARHIVANFRKRFSGVHYENMFWKASKASNEPLFNAAMKEIQVLNPAAYDYLMETNPKYWSRAFFQEGKMCDAVENGLSESFNSVIRDARKKPIITMLEEIRLYVMERLYWQVLPSGLNQFETRNLAESYDVDLDKKTCTCRVWQLNGYGCVHLVATISYLNRDIATYVDPMLYAAFYKNTYKYHIHGMNGSNMWPVNDFIPPLPPLKRRMPGRPKVNRRRDASEKLPRHTVSKACKIILCSVCRQSRHNKVTCPTVERPHVERSRVQRSMKLKVKKRKTIDKGKDGEGSSGPNRDGEGRSGPTTGYEGRSGPKIGGKRKKSERITKKKLAKKVKTKDGKGETSANPVDLNE
ncbi:uncharacterized protein LOC111885278 [Lactuca sativa]|uniref:uncharacterized protein LOC111885278 n=1 Tax=Lactuca sativa TaxID=4236 RepID=UPI0022B04D3B|nr:uncharacterized protein LOC111885278 [Lactuca sativa]